MENEKKQATESEKEVVEIEDVDAGLKPEDVKDVREATQKEIIENHVLNKEQQKIFMQMMKEAKMPHKMKDSEFKLGEKELDIRSLSSANRLQMIFRALMLNSVYSKQMLTSLVDITRLLMILLDFLGIEDIIQSTDDIIDKIAKQNKLKKDAKAKKDDKDKKVVA